MPKLIFFTSNLMIMLAYLGIAAFLAPRFTLTANRFLLYLTRVAAVVFFTTSALTHAELLIHFPGAGEWHKSFHGLFIHTAQAIAGWTFLLIGARRMDIHIYDRADMDELVNARIVALGRELNGGHHGRIHKP